MGQGGGARPAIKGIGVDAKVFPEEGQKRGVAGLRNPDAGADSSFVQPLDDEFCDFQRKRR